MGLTLTTAVPQTLGIGISLVRSCGGNEGLALMLTSEWELINATSRFVRANGVPCYGGSIEGLALMLTRESQMELAGMGGCCSAHHTTPLFPWSKFAEHK